MKRFILNFNLIFHRKVTKKENKKLQKPEDNFFYFQYGKMFAGFTGILWNPARATVFTNFSNKEKFHLTRCLIITCLARIFNGANTSRIFEICVPNCVLFQVAERPDELIRIINLQRISEITKELKFEVFSYSSCTSALDSSSVRVTELIDCV